MPDAIVIGSGPNGLSAAICAARAGWSVTVIEAMDSPGGAVRSAQLTLPGHVHDVFSGFYPMVRPSRVMRSFDLEECGLRWREAPLHNAHPGPDGCTAVIAPRLDETAEILDVVTPGDGEAWRRFVRLGQKACEPLMDTLFSPIPPLRRSARLAWALRDESLFDFARFCIASVRTVGEDWFAGEPARRQLAGLALHADLAPELPTTGVYATMLAWCAQIYGYPVPEGGAGQLTAALVRRLSSHGGSVRCNSRVTGIEVRHGRAVAVRCADGTTLDARRAVFADVTAPSLIGGLIPPEHWPPAVLDRLRRFRRSSGTFKVDWALTAPVPWKSDEARRSATVHLGDSVDDMSRYSNEFGRGLLPTRPYVLIGQQSLADPTRAPEGRHTLWGYTHVPSEPSGDAEGVLDCDWGRAAAGFADRIEDRVEEYAPGFREVVAARHVMAPADLLARNLNLEGGDLSGGTFDITQQLVFRPLPGLYRYRMPVKGVYLCSAAAHPGGGVHGACGAAAWHAALQDSRLLRI